MPLKMTYVDAFTAEPFGGNAAAVCFMRESRDDAWMQKVAREMNQAETAFVRTATDGFDLRWFTPTVEMDLCGHATLATAHVLWESGDLPLDRTARFHTRSGLLTATRADGWLELDFPATPAAPVPTPPGLEEALGAKALFVGKSPFDYLIEVRDEATVRGLKPDFSALAKFGGRGFIVTSRPGGSGCDFVSRFFAPAAGINEDPATGSAHCALAPFWAERLSQTTFVARQLSERGALLKVRLQGNRVLLGGQAVTVMRGELSA